MANNSLTSPGNLNVATPLLPVAAETTTTPNWNLDPLSNSQDEDSAAYIVNPKAPGVYINVHAVTNNGTIIYPELEVYDESITQSQRSLKIMFSRYHWKNREWRTNIDSEFKELK